MRNCWYEATGEHKAATEREESEEQAELTGSEWVKAKLGFEADAVQTRLLNGPGKRVLVNCTRQWGKTTVMAARAVMEAELKPGSVTVVASKSERQSNIFLGKAREFAKRLGYEVRGDGQNQISLALPNGSRMVGLPGTDSTVRGFSKVELLVFDEAAQVTDALYGALTPMLAVSNGGLWLISTPFGRRGFFWREWSKGGPEWERVSVKAEDCERIPAWFLAEERRRQGERNFRQEYCCEFVQEEDALFDRELVGAAFTEEVDPWPE